MMDVESLKVNCLSKENFIKSIKEVMKEYNIVIKYYEFENEFVFMNNDIYVYMYDFMK